MKANTWVKGRPLSVATQNVYSIIHFLGTYKSTYKSHKLAVFQNDKHANQSIPGKVSVCCSQDWRTFSAPDDFFYALLLLAIGAGLDLCQRKTRPSMTTLTDFAASHQLDLKCTALIITKKYIIFLDASIESSWVTSIKYEKDILKKFFTKITCKM